MDVEHRIRIERVVAEWNQGRSGPEIAAALGLTKRYVKSLLEQARNRGMVVRPGELGRHSKPETTKLRNRVVLLWNKGNTQTEIGALLGLTRGAVGRLICEARKSGVVTVRYSTSETSKRQAAAVRKPGRTSIKLEQEFWDGLDEMCAALGVRRNGLIIGARIDRPHGTLTSAVRVAVLEWFRDRANGKESNDAA